MKLGLVVVVVLVITRLRQPRLMADGLLKAGRGVMGPESWRSETHRWSFDCSSRPS